MNDQFDELTKSLAQSVTRCGALKKFGAGLAVVACVTLFAGQPHAADLYVDASVGVNGDGTAARPYWRITDAVARARLLRQTAAIPASEIIVIHVAAGAYLGSKVPSVLAKNPRYEILPILLNIPNLNLVGSTVLTTDPRGLPTGIVPGSETLLGTEDHYGSTGKSLILISRTTDGLVGDDVTVSGFHLDWLNGREQGDCSIRLDRVLRFVLRQNCITRSDIGIYATRASGSIEGNLIRDGASGVAAKGGSRAHPSEYSITGNRSVASRSSGLVIEADGLGRQIDVGANEVKLPPLPSSESRDDPPMTTVATVVDNDCSDNTSAGLKCFLYAPPQKPINPLLSSGVLVPRLTVMVSDNTFHRNGTYGLVVEGNNVFRSINYPLTGEFHGQFQNNSFADNIPAQALFTFVALGISLGDTDSLKFIKYLQNATFDITDMDGELADYDYYNPVTDPFDGTVLNNTLIVNGSVIPPGTRISP